MIRLPPAWLLVLPLLVLYGVLVGVPVLGILVKSFTSSHTLDFELLYPEKLAAADWTLENYVALLREGYYLTATFNTVAIAVVSVVSSVLLGTPIAYLLSRPGVPGRVIWEWIISLPIYLSGVLASYALLLFFSRRGLLSTITEAIFGNPLHILGTISAVILGTTYIILPMFVRVARAGFLNIPSEIYEASLTLGADEFGTFRRIMLPQALPAIGAGVAITFTYAMSLVVVILVLGSGGATFTILPLEILDQTRSTSMNIPLAAAMAVLLLIVAAVGQLIADRLLRGGERDPGMQVG